MSLNQYIVSIDAEKRNIHAITAIYATGREEAREIVKDSAPEAVIGVYDEFPTILIEDGTNYVLSAWKPLQYTLIVAKQKEKILALEKELNAERLKLMEYQDKAREAEEETRAIPQF